MTKRMGWGLILIAALWTGALYFNNTDSHATSNEKLPRISFKAPEFSLPSLNGQTYSIKGAEGKPLVINFWASWCGPCREETPELVKLYAKYKGKFQLYGVNMTNEDSIGAVKRFVQHFKMNYPILIDRNGKVNHRYNIRAVPTSYFVNKNGVIVDKAIGYPGANVMIKKVKSLISHNQ